jgi:proteic killer suppression protein
MKVRFSDGELEGLYASGRGRLARRFPPEVVRAFFRVMLVVRAAEGPSELRKFRGLHYHALRGSRKGQHALRLNDQFRLIVEEEGKRMHIVEITDYH